MPQGYCGACLALLYQFALVFSSFSFFLGHDAIVPQIRAGKQVLIAAHGNSLRALVKYLGMPEKLALHNFSYIWLDNISEEEIVELNIPTGIPLVYELDENLRPVKHYYLADEEAVKAAQAAVANQGKAKWCEETPKRNSMMSPF